MWWHWAAVAGLFITALGIVLGIIPPQPAGLWGAETSAEHAHERQVRQRYWISVVLIVVGTLLQVPTNLP
jgi:hypothetical protein